jgi:hypothetical protein
MKVGLLTEEQRKIILQEKITDNWNFNPIQDKNKNWIISVEEINNSTIEWIKSIPIINWEE